MHLWFLLQNSEPAFAKSKQFEKNDHLTLIAGSFINNSKRRKPKKLKILRMEKRKYEKLFYVNFLYFKTI